MDLVELKKEQLKLAAKIVLRDSCTTVKTIGGIDCVTQGNELIACVVVCEFPSMKVLETKTYVLPDPFRYVPGFQAYREMPAMIEAYNQLEQEPDLLLVSGAGIAHPRRIGIASHVGLILNKATIGVAETLFVGHVQQGKIMVENEIVGFEIKTREHSNPIYVSPGHLVSLGMTLNIIPQTIQYPHKMPEPLHIAHKVGRKKGKREIDVKNENLMELQVGVEV
ncbi:MAG: endonuclease V [Nanoarchaeota archaeon]|nr:endonuclease V [Nanoarchaeota archaeon]